MDRREKITFRDVITYAAMAATVAFHAGTYVAVKERVDRHELALEILRQKSARQDTDIEILGVKLKHVRFEK